MLFISQLNGLVLAVPAPLQTSPPAAMAAAVVLNLSSVVARYGYHGLSSIAVAGGFLFAAYQQTNSSFGPGMELCTDFGAPGGRAAAAILGCPTFGVVARFSITADSGMPAGVRLGAEQRLVDASPYMLCAQFSTSGVAHLLFDAAATTLYVSAGTGADDNNVPDYGQLGGGPCDVNASFGGEFRAQLGAGMDGAVTAFTGAGLFTPTIGLVTQAVVAKGLHGECARERKAQEEEREGHTRARARVRACVRASVRFPARTLERLAHRWRAPRSIRRPVAHGLGRRRGRAVRH